MTDLVALKRQQIEIQRKKLRLVEKELYSGNLAAFSRAAWPIIEGGRPCRWNWHHDVICDHLMAVMNGEILRLIINVPPRTMKSTLINVMFPSFVWTTKPEHRFLNISTDANLAIRDSASSRRIIESDWYSTLFGDVFHLVDDQNQKQWFQNDKTGTRQAVGITGRLIGKGADTITIDDANNPDEIYSQPARETVIAAYDQGISTRLNDPKTGAIVAVQQRLHEDDLTGHLLKQPGWTHLVLPMEYEHRHPQRSIYDIRTKEGQLLWPDHVPANTLEQHKKDTYKWAGQFQQRPAPAGGGIIKESWWARWEQSTLPECDFIFQSYDLSYGETADSDFSARTTWGLFTHEEEGQEPKDCLILLEAWRERLTFPDLLKEARRSFDDGVRGQKIDMVLVEAKANGLSLIQMMRKVRIPVRSFNPGKANKIARVHAALPWIEDERIWLPWRKSKDDWQSWSRLVVDQCNAFPNGSTDDIVDTVTQAIIYAKSNQLIRHSEELEEDYEAPLPRMSAYG